ncbi:MAG: hypothetical protein INQ03_22225 [Candidatus Heimdallarchaeota archaeon]|nr:hypothetical protein [Candidatus Heimdallarchaeota archaeon]
MNDLAELVRLSGKILVEDLKERLNLEEEELIKYLLEHYDPLFHDKEITIE